MCSSDLIGVISKGEIILVEDKAALMQKLGKKQLSIQLKTPLAAIPDALNSLPLERSDDGLVLTYTFDSLHQGTGIADLMRQLALLGLDVRDLQTQQSSLEDIFVSLVSERA